jgi:molybdate transport system ATP-binding protein
MTHARLTRTLPRLPLQVEFSLPSGITAISGPAGAGKSLVLNLIAGFDRPDSGRILVEDALVFDGDTGVNLPPRFRQVGYVGSTDALFAQMTVKQNLMFAAQRWARLERHKRVAEMAERFQLVVVMDLKPAGLAALQALDCAVARALLAEPKVLLLEDRGADEALLEKVRSAFSGPVLVVTNDFDLCYAAADALILIDGGRIVQHGPARETIENPRSADAARLLGIANIFPAEIAGLDPGRNTSLLQCGGFELTAPYLPGHFKGDRVTVAVRAEDVRTHSGELERGTNYIRSALTCTTERPRSVRLEFANGIRAERTREQWVAQRDNRSWQVELPPQALRIF